MQCTVGRLAGFLVGSALLLAGCADLEVKKLGAADTEPLNPLKGQFTYFLPRTAIAASLSATVSQCGALVDDPTTGKNVDPTQLAFKVTATVTPTIEADPNYEYALDYDAAESWLKEINFSVTTASNKVLGSINTQINDQAGPIIVATITTIVQIAGSAIIPHATLTDVQTHQLEQDAGPYCSDDVLKGLGIVNKDNALVAKLKDRIKQYQVTLANGAMPGKDDPTTAWSQAITMLQSEITTVTAKQLIAKSPQSFRWVPGYADMAAFTADDGRAIYAGGVQLPIDQVVPKLLSDLGKNWYTDNSFNSPPHANDEAFRSWYVVHEPYLLVLAIDKATYFDWQSFKDKQDPKKDPLAMKSPGGLLVRDPAVGVVQKCDAPKVEKDAPPVYGLTQDPTTKSWQFAVPNAATLCKSISLTASTGTTADNESPRVATTVPQFGRVLVFDAHSGLFENVSLSLQLNSDGTIQTVSTHDLSTAATGISGLGAAAQAASQAQANRNTAIGAANTAAITQIQLPDTKNKALADCLQQAATIVKAGGTPVPCQ